MYKEIREKADELFQFQSNEFGIEGKQWQLCGQG